MHAPILGDKLLSHCFDAWGVEKVAKVGTWPGERLRRLAPRAQVTTGRCNGMCGWGQSCGDQTTAHPAKLWRHKVQGFAEEAEAKLWLPPTA